MAKNDTKNYRPFDIELAKLGAPVGNTRGHPVRIICFDRVIGGYSIGDKTEVLALHDHLIPEHGESLIVHKNNGGVKNFHDEGSTLCMLPLGMIEGKPLFVGDEFEFRVSWCENFIWKNQTAGVSTTIPSPGAEYRWPKKKVIKESWVAVYERRRQERDVGYVTGMTQYDSKEACVLECKDLEGFLYAIKIGAYEVEE